MLVKIKEILTKMYFICPAKLLYANLCYLHHNIQTIFGPYLVAPKVSRQ